MCSIIFLFISFLAIVMEPSDSKDFPSRSRVRYRHFEDYLTHMGKREQAFITGEIPLADLAEGSGDIEAEVPILTRRLPFRTGSFRSKETTCCMLGQLAADKGYHCFAKFYASRVIFRNYNRAHNKKIVGLQPRYSSQSGMMNPARESAEKLMRTFSQCVTHRAMIFHKCCHLSAIEKDPLKSERGSSGRLITNKV